MATVSVTKRSLPHRTNVSHFLLFIEEITIVLNRLRLHSMYSVMDNATIHKVPEVLKAIHNCEHTALTSPSYSRMLNPIEEYWARIKYEVCETSLVKTKLIVNRIE